MKRLDFRRVIGHYEIERKPAVTFCFKIDKDLRERLKEVSTKFELKMSACLRYLITWFVNQDERTQRLLLHDADALTYFEVQDFEAEDVADYIETMISQYEVTDEKGE